MSLCVYFRLEENYELAEGVCIPRSTMYVVMYIFQVGGELWVSGGCVYTQEYPVCRCVYISGWRRTMS